ncbi:MAG: uracil-DNA glycosylase [Anaerorhabdus sp.]
MGYWKQVMEQESKKDYFVKLMNFVEGEYQTKIIYPAKENLLSVFEETPFEMVKVVILGQDPYHGENQAHGLAFSTQKAVPIPPSLKNIYKELNHDLGIKTPNHGCLKSWAKQGVFLLNTILTVEKGKPLSHHGKGWEIFTDQIIMELDRKEEGIIFVLWGAHAQKKKSLILNPLHGIIEAPHPSPLSAHRGFFDSAPFSKINERLTQQGQDPIDWRIEDSEYV